MNKVRQFWALLKFQAALKSFVIVMPLVIATPYFLPFLIHTSGHSDLQMLLLNTNLFFVGYIGFLLLDPEGFQGTITNYASGSEFILTRAVDRHLVLRARSFFFYFLILFIPLCALLAALKNPSVAVTEYSQVSQRQILDHIPGSFLAQPGRDRRSNDIIIPDGNILIDSWRIWAFVGVAIATQVLILFVFPLKYKRILCFGIILIVILFPILKNIWTLKATAPPHASDEASFYFYIAHQGLLWGITIAALFLGQFWCERRYVRLEQ